MRTPPSSLLFAALLVALQSASAVPTQPPNILWLTSEDNSAHWLGCYGNAHADTPHLDRLADEGFLYEHAYANAPVCAPMRSTWITGVMAISMGTHPMRSRHAIPHNQMAYYPDRLRSAGYYTGNDSKTDYNIGGRPDSDCWDNQGAVDWGELESRQPFFQVINFGKSHEGSAFGDIDNTTHDPVDTALAKYHPDLPDIRKNYAHYHDAVTAMDAQVGATLEKLSHSGLAESTIVVYCSDHGGVLPRSKRFLFQNSLHCPLVIRIPQQFKALWPAEAPGSRVGRLVSFVDMPKTWLSLAGIRTPEYMQGTTFLGPHTEPERPYHFAFRGRMDECVDNARALCDKRYLYIRNYMPYVPWMQHLEYLWQMRATQAWEQAVLSRHADCIQSRFFAPKGWTEELYDMRKDPDNVNNLIGDPDHQQIAATMRHQLREQQCKVHDAGLMPESEMVRLAKGHNTTIFELVRDPSIYNLPALLDAADLALEEDARNLPALRRLMESQDVGLRYWGVVGCFLLNDKEGGQRAIADESHEVRAMAAWLLVRTGEREQGIACLNDMIEKRSYALLTLLNMANWMGDSGRELLPAIRQLEFEEAFRNQYKYPLRMRRHVLERYAE